LRFKIATTLCSSELEDIAVCSSDCVVDCALGIKDIKGVYGTLLFKYM